MVNRKRLPLKRNTGIIILGALLTWISSGHPITLDFAADNEEVEQDSEYFDSLLQRVKGRRSVNYNKNVNPLVPAALSAIPYFYLRIIELQDDMYPDYTLGAIGALAGSGQLYLGSFREALAYSLGVSGLYLYTASELDFYSNNPDQWNSGSQEWLTLVLTAGMDLNFLSIFDAYQLSRVLSRNRGFTTPLTYTPVTSLLKAPFQGKYLKRKGTLFPVGLSLLYSVVMYRIDKHNGTTLPQVDPYLFGKKRTRTQAFGLGFSAAGITSMGAGAGEEAAFRGVLQNEFSRYTGPLLGWAAASTLFGFAHYDSETENMEKFYFTGVLGAYLGYLYHRNQYDLRQSVAVHFWWDFFLFLESFLGRPNAENHLLRVGFSF